MGIHLENTGTHADDWAAALVDAGFAGAMILPTDPGYDEARSVWNGMIDRHPGLIVRPSGTRDVTAAVRLAADRHIELAVRGGGHNVAGNAVCDGGLVIDLSALNEIQVDPEARTVRVGGGATWAEVDRETQRYGLAAPGGVVSDTGVAGLTLGGGLGHLRRRYGLSCDGLRSVQIITADGEPITASAASHPELFWALKGGGGNFGVVTAFEFDLHPVGPEVFMLFVWHRGDSAVEALRAFRDYATSAPDEASVLAFHAFVPTVEEFPERYWGDPALVFFGCHVGDPGTAESDFRALREVARPIADLSGSVRYTELQKALDEDYPKGLRYYWKSAFVNDLNDDLINEIITTGNQSPSSLSTIDIWHMGGEIARIPEADSPFGNRDAPFLINPEANWQNPEEDEANVAWARNALDRITQFARSGLYVNFPGFGEEGKQLVRDSYGSNFDRLVAVKQRYDPNNLFHLNQNIAPAQD